MWTRGERKRLCLGSLTLGLIVWRQVSGQVGGRARDTFGFGSIIFWWTFVA